MVAVAIAFAFGDVRTSAFVDLTGSVADTTCVVRSDTIVDVVTEAVLVEVGCARASAHAQGVVDEARTVVFIGILGVIAGFGVCAARNDKFARAVLVFGSRVEVVGALIRASARVAVTFSREGACTVKEEVQHLGLVAVAHGEYLDVDLA